MRVPSREYNNVAGLVSGKRLIIFLPATEEDIWFFCNQWLSGNKAVGVAQVLADDTPGAKAKLICRLQWKFSGHPKVKKFTFSNLLVSISAQGLVLVGAQGVEAATLRQLAGLPSIEGESATLISLR